MLLGFTGYRLQTLQHFFVNCLSLVTKGPLTNTTQFNNSRIYLQSVSILRCTIIVIDSEVKLLNSLHIVDAVLVTWENLFPDTISDSIIDLDTMFLQGYHKQLCRALVGLVLASLIYIMVK
jgi:hypothetical protein